MERKWQVLCHEFFNSRTFTFEINNAGACERFLGNVDVVR